LHELLGSVRNARRMALSCMCIWRFYIYSHLQCLQYISFGSRRVLLGSCWTCVCQESLVERTKPCELFDWWQIGRDRRQSESVHSVNKIQVMSSMIRAVNVSRMQTVYVWRSRCAYRLSLEQSLRERKD